MTVLKPHSNINCEQCLFLSGQTCQRNIVRRDSSRQAIFACTCVFRSLGLPREKRETVCCLHHSNYISLVVMRLQCTFGLCLEPCNYGRVLKSLEKLDNK